MGAESDSDEGGEGRGGDDGWEEGLLVISRDRVEGDAAGGVWHGLRGRKVDMSRGYVCHVFGGQSSVNESLVMID